MASDPWTAGSWEPWRDRTKVAGGPLLYAAGAALRAVVSAVRRLAPSQGRDATVPPVGVLVTWLAQQGLVELSRPRKSTQANSATSTWPAHGVSALGGTP